MSDTVINPVKRAAAGLTRKHSRLSILAASAATAGVLGAAGAVLATAPWSAAAGDAAKTVPSGSTAAFDAVTGATAQLDSAHTAAAGTTTTAVGTAAFSGTAAHHPAKAAVETTAKHVTAKHEAKQAPAKHAAKQHAKPYQIYDSVTPSSLPSGKDAAVYANGAYATSAHQVAGHKSVLWIDTNGSNPGANVLDVEPGDATPAAAAAWAQQRLVKHPGSVAIIYTMRSSWQDVKDNVAHLPKAQQDNVRYWIADPTGVKHIVPGSDATQWYWGSSIDISAANPSLTQVG
jgi:hypothetical protein